MAVTPTSFKTLLPEFALQADGRVQLFLDQAARRLSSDTLGSFYDDAITYLSAHLITLAQRNAVAFAAGASGPVTSATVGPLSRSFAAGASGGGNGFDSTPYGVEYENLLRLAFVTPQLAW